MVHKLTIYGVFDAAIGTKGATGNTEDAAKNAAQASYLGIGKVFKHDGRSFILSFATDIGN